MTFPYINYNHEFKKKMPVSFLTDWHYANAGLFLAQNWKISGKLSEYSWKTKVSFSSEKD